MEVLLFATDVCDNENEMKSCGVGLIEENGGDGNFKRMDQGFIRSGFH